MAADDAEETAAEVMAKAAELLQKIASPFISFVFESIPIVINVAQSSYNFYKRLPTNYIHFLIGTIMCFFGGIYPTVFAAIEAAEHGGLTTVRKALKDVSEEILIIVEESKKDDATDEDKDGVNDVKQISGKALVKRKLKLVLTKMDPNKVNAAIQSIYKVWMSVLAVLTIKFARTIALALSISDFVKKFVNRFILPIIRGATPPEYKKWVPVISDWCCKSIGISIAWKVQSVISAFASSMAGGLIMSRALLVILSTNGFEFGGINDHRDTIIDEIASYFFAGLGFYFQFYFGFSAPFPLNIVLYPVQMMDYYIRHAVTSK
mmetsp:Transcript_16609/g.33758  ORF Transcript_16609/g.33758 Transcript_16609/m.33758 type:complete len:321 (+) Transcript_16609:82-1044(+)